MTHSRYEIRELRAEVSSLIHKQIVNTKNKAPRIRFIHGTRSLMRLVGSHRRRRWAL